MTNEKDWKMFCEENFELWNSIQELIKEHNNFFFLIQSNEQGTVGPSTWLSQNYVISQVAGSLCVIFMTLLNKYYWSCNLVVKRSLWTT